MQRFPGGSAPSESAIRPGFVKFVHAYHGAFGSFLYGPHFWDRHSCGADHRSALQQAVDRRDSRASTAVEQPAHFDGCFSGWTLLVTVNAGFSVFESQYMQSLAVLDTQTGAVVDFPDDRTLVRAKQTHFSGLAFSRDGKHLYASMASLTDPLANGKDATGNGI